MKLCQTILAFVCFVGGTAAVHQTRGWRGIIPLHSSRADVERILGPANKAYKSIYKTDKELVEVQYSSAPCKGNPPGWNVGTDTVLSITITPNDWLRFADLGVEESQYVRTSDPDNRTTHYTNRTEGIRYTLTEDGRVYYISYTPSTNDNELRCKGFPKNTEITNGYSRFDYYSDISFKEEKARLDNFAAWLHEHPDLKGYIIVYGGQRARHPRDADERASRAKHYLINVRKMRSERLRTINGGLREKLEVELYALPADLPPPTPSPAVSTTYVRP